MNGVMEPRDHIGDRDFYEREWISIGKGEIVVTVHVKEDGRLSIGVAHYPKSSWLSFERFS